jgi:hypothetical protein
MLAAGKYRLNGLLRGRMGTEWAMDSHSIGERFILLDGRLGQDDSALALLGLPRLYKAVSIGSPLSSAEDISFTYTGAALRPYAPVHLQGTRDSSGNLTLSWIRRARLQGEWREYADVPLLEESERYEVEILDGSDVVRVIASTTPAASYSATEQVADFGSTQTSLSVKVYQLSAVVGRGRGASGVI